MIAGVVSEGYTVTILHTSVRRLLRDRLRHQTRTPTYYCIVPLLPPKWYYFSWRW